MSITTITRISKRSLISDSSTTPVLAILVAVFILFSLFIPNFRTIRTVGGIVNSSSVNAIVVLGITLLMIAGEFDLSVGAIMAMGGYIFAINILNGKSPVTTVALTLLVTTFMGTINGLITIGTRIPSFIVTLGTRSIYRAAIWVYSGGLLVQTTERLPIYEFFNGRLDIVNNLFPLANFRTSTLWMICLALIFQFLLARTAFGNHIFASGGNSEAAKAQGVNVKLTKLLCFSLTGCLAGLAGILLFSEFTTVFVGTATNVELIAIAAAVVGGTLLEGGAGSIMGGLIGILLISVLRRGVVLFGVPSDNFEAIVGLTIIGAVILNKWIRNRLL